ncbi:hypothetical protein OH76DRAFT_1338351 [Lentinus brumalis]|uniref:Uncharacterized protein n=1 Tax=Lentinus brumalis TaxID=2498619 RepID=A0A371DUH7_9APHY|nr:hypothetical protein OH76DRAFT_1338351 [Polyporus brumalis]
MQLLDGDDLVRLRQVSRLAETHVASTIHIRSRALFADIVWDYERLVTLLDDNSAVVGGAGAVYILFPTPRLPDRIHIYVPHDRYYQVVRYLERIERFNAEHLVHHHRSGMLFPEGVANMIRLTKGRLTIDAVQSTNRSPLYPITAALHTGYFNFVSARAFGSSYPSLTRDCRALLNPARLEKFLNVRKEDLEESDWWRKQGWTLQVEWESWAPGGICTGVDSVGCPSAMRAFGDRMSFRGSSAPIAGRVGQTLDPIESITAVWWRGGHTCSPTCHSGQVVITPGARICLRDIVR